VEEIMYRGVCSACRQQSEMHEGPGGIRLCEDCLHSGKMPEGFSAGEGKKLDPRLEPTNGAVPETAAPPLTDKREKYIDHIINYADSLWIDRFIKKETQYMRSHYKWVELLQRIQDDKVLMRIARELDFGKEEEIRKPMVIVSETESKVPATARPRKARRRKAKPSIFSKRHTEAQTSKPA